MGVSMVSITEKVKECVPTEEASTDAEPKYQFLLRNIVILAPTNLRSQYLGPNSTRGQIEKSQFRSHSQFCKLGSALLLLARLPAVASHYSGQD